MTQLNPTHLLIASACLLVASSVAQAQPARTDTPASPTTGTTDISPSKPPGTPPSTTQPSNGMQDQRDGMNGSSMKGTTNKKNSTTRPSSSASTPTDGAKNSAPNGDRSMNEGATTNPKTSTGSTSNR